MMEPIYDQTRQQVADTEVGWLLIQQQLEQRFAEAMAKHAPMSVVGIFDDLELFVPGAEPETGFSRYLGRRLLS